MVKQTTDILSGYILEDETRLTLRQLCDACAVRAEYIIELVDVGKAKRLQHDLGVNLAGVALAIELIDEIESLRARLDRM